METAFIIYSKTMVGDCLSKFWENNYHTDVDLVAEEIVVMSNRSIALAMG